MLPSGVIAHQSVRVNVSVILEVSVHLVQEEALDQVVVLVLPEFVANVSQNEVGPVSLLHSMQISVVLDHLDPFLHDFRVQCGVDGVPRGAQGRDRRSVVALVLLLGEVFYMRVRGVEGGGAYHNTGLWRTAKHRAALGFYQLPTSCATLQFPTLVH